MTFQSPDGTDHSIRTDLFVMRQDGYELYFEMKTPEPNKGQCKQMKYDILLIVALRKDHIAEAYAACAYNPYGDGKPYRYGYALQFLEVGKDLLVGREFWSLIGDATTYDELLEISAEVGDRIKPLLEQAK